MGGFSAARRGTIKCNCTVAPQAGKERLFCLFQITEIHHNFFKRVTNWLISLILHCVDL